MSSVDDRVEVGELFQNLKAQLPALEKLLAKCSGLWGYEDPIYRFYHQSLKVFHLQDKTLALVAALQALAPNRHLNPRFTQIVYEGTGKEFTLGDNSHWPERTRPIVEAFFHARYFLEMAVKYGRELDAPPDPLPGGWAAFLYLYNLR